MQIAREKSQIGFWMGVSPVLLMLALAFPLVRLGMFSWLFPTLLTISLIGIWAFRGLGSVVAATGMTLYLSLAHHSIAPESILWRIAFVASVATALLLFGYCIEEGEKQVESASSDLADRLAALEEELQEKEANWHAEKSAEEEKLEEMASEIRQAYDEVDSYKRLVVASQEEAEKYFKLYSETSEKMYTQS